MSAVVTAERRWEGLEKKGLVPLLPSSWLPDAEVQGVIYHWTAGTYRVSSVDRQHYHFIVEEVKPGIIRVHRGIYTPVHNDPEQMGPLRHRSNYAAHTAGANSFRVGIAIACMRGATPGNHGKYPVTRPLAEALSQVGAEVLKRYGVQVPVSYRTCLSHAEVERYLGADQNGKWDISELSFNPHLNPQECGRLLRLNTNLAAENLS